MKPIQPHKDPRITNISFDNFTGSICIITPISDDEETKDLMLSSSQTNGDNDRFKSQHHHLSLITQPILAGRARRKDKIDSITNSRRSSYNDSPSLILPTNRTERISYEKKLNPQESSDSGVDFSLSTNSSVQYSQQQQQHTNIHRPLSALNEDSNTDDGFREQPIQYPIINIKDYDSMENTIDKHHSNEQEKLNTIRETNLSRMNFLHPPPTSSIQQYHSLNDLTNTKQNKSSRKKPKLNIIIEPSIPSSHLNINDEQIFPINRIPSSTSSINQTKIQQQQQIKPKSITPLGCYPNQEQIRAHINRSVIERQHPSYLPMSQQKDPRQLNIPSKTNNILFQKPKLQNLNKISYRQTKQILPDLYHEEILDDHHEKRRLNKINKWQENSQKEQIRSRTIKDIQQPLKTNLKHEIHQDNFLTSTPRRHYEHGQSINTNFKRQQQQPINPSYKSKLIGFPIQNKTSSYNRTINPKSEYSPRNTIVSFQTHHPKKLLNNHIEQIHPLNFRHKTLAESMNNLLETTHIQPMNINNSRRENPSKLNKTNKFFQTRSPTSGSLISEHHESSSSSPHNELNQTYRLIPTDEQQQQQQLIDGRYVIPANISQIPMLVDCASQTSSRHTQPFTCTNDSKTNNEMNIDNPSNELTPPDNMENSNDDRSCSSSSLDRFSPHDRFPLPLGKVTIAMDKDDLSTNYDSDDGWSDESADVIYVDERYITPKKKTISSSSILQFISQQHIQQ